MLSMRVDHVVSMLVNQFLVRNGRLNEAMYFKIDCSLNVYHDNVDSYSERCGLHLLYQQDPNSSGVNVFSATTKSPFANVREVTDWNHLTSHDICWREVSIFSDVYFGLAEKINASLKADRKPGSAPRDMHEHTSFALFHEAFVWVPVSIAIDPNCKRSYRKIVTVK